MILCQIINLVLYIVFHFIFVCNYIMTIVGKKKVTDGIKLDGSTGIFHKLYVDQKRAIRFPEELNIHQDSVDRTNMTEREK